MSEIKFATAEQQKLAQERLQPVREHLIKMTRELPTGATIVAGTLLVQTNIGTAETPNFILMALDLKLHPQSKDETRLTYARTLGQTLVDL